MIGRFFLHHTFDYSLLYPCFYHTKQRIISFLNQEFLQKIIKELIVGSKNISKTFKTYIIKFVKEEIKTLFLYGEKH